MSTLFHREDFVERNFLPRIVLLVLVFAFAFLRTQCTPNPVPVNPYPTSK